MKKFMSLFILIGLLVFPIMAKAEGFGAGYRYLDRGYFYSDVNLPYATGKAINIYEQKNVQGKILPVSNEANNNKVSITTMKRGQSSRTNYMLLVEIGNAGILEAAKNGGINKIHFIEVTREKLYVPLIFIPVYFDRFITTVYGE